MMGRGFAQGAFRTTEQPFDVAIEGRGFFQVRRADGSTGLTRDGSFRADATGRLVNAQGNVLLPELRLPEGADTSGVGIRSDGTVTLRDRAVGRIAVVEVRSPEALRPTGDGLFTATAESGPARAADGARVVQGVLEGSNVDIGDAMVDMIDAQRSFSLPEQGDPDAGPDDGDRQRGEAMIPGVGAAASQALPAVPSTALPAEVREGSADDRKAYAAALGFEKILLGQLAQSMTDSMGESSGPEGPAREMMGDALAEAVATGGGTGLALDLYRDMRLGDAR